MRQRITILFLFYCTAALSQQELNYSFRHIDQTQGLLHNTVLSITQDKRGFMWLQTEKGLQRYDGLRFVNYQPELSNATKSYPSVPNLYADSKYLWVFANDQLNKLEFLTNKFTAYSKEQIPDSSFSKYESFTDWNNSKWLINNVAIYYYDSTGKQMVQYLTGLPVKLSSTSIVRDENKKETWVAASGLLLFDYKTKKIYSSEHNSIQHPLLQQLKGKTVSNIMLDSHHNIWMTSWSHFLYKYDPVTKRLTAYSLKKIAKAGDKTNNGTLLNTYIFEDNHATIWAATENAGLLRYNSLHDNFDHIVADEKSNRGIKYNYSIYCIFQDKEDNIWLGTDKGINIFNPYQNYIQSVQHENHNKSLPKNEILGLIQTNTGDILVGTWGGGISVYDSALQFKKNISIKGAYENNLVWCFIQKEHGKIWIGCQHGYLHTYDPVTSEIATIHPAEFQGSTIWCMQKDNEENIWFGLNNGKIAKWDKSSNKFFSYNDSLKGLQQIFHAVHNIFIDRSNNIWVSTDYGLKQFDPLKRIYTAVYLSDEKNTASVSSNNICGIEQYDDTTLIIGTRDAGLNFFKQKNKTFTHFTIRDGLPSNSVYAVKKDAENNIWLTSDYSFYKLTPGQKKVIIYNMPPGIINSSFEFNNFYPLRDGRWLTATLTEVIAFKPEEFSQAEGTPKITISGFRVFDKPIFIDSLLAEKMPVKLNYKQNFFSVEFSDLSFSNIQQTKYFYRLSSVDKNWVYAGEKGLSNYTNLEPGNYTFKVKASEENDAANITSFSIIITPPFWKTWWFISIIFFCILLFIYLFIRWREKNIKAIEAEKLKVQQLNAREYKSKLELEQITSYFSFLLIDKNTVDDALWDVAKNLIGKLGFVDCMIYLWNDDKTKMIQRAGFGPKGTIKNIKEQPFDVMPGQGVVGYVMQRKEPVLIPDTSKDNRYRPDEMVRSSEITVPIIYNNELIGVIDSEHHEKNFFTQQHLQVLSTIATLIANKIKSIEAERLLQRNHIEMYSMNEQLSKAKLEALRSQMNPHFIFNCLTSIDNLIQMDEKEKATLYLSKFAKLIRSILENSVHNEVPCWKDIETLNLYLQLEELRWDKKFSYDLIVADEILNGDYKVPPLIIQPFVENAIHHGLLNKIDGDKKLIIHVSIVNSQVHYVIEDNGVGRAKANAYKQLNKPSHQSMGMQITTDRINLYNQNNNSYVIITDMVNEMHESSGTKVEISL
jgi:ligand-binding sensor domain-containing protein